MASAAPGLFFLLGKIERAGRIYSSRLSLLVCARPVVPVPAAGLGSRPVLTGWRRGDSSELHQEPPRLGGITHNKVISVTGRNNLRLGETVKNGFPFLFAYQSHKRLISSCFTALCRVIRALLARRGREGVSVYPAPNTRLKRLIMAYLSVVYRSRASLSCSAISAL